jgi:hypothetical protein
MMPSVKTVVPRFFFSCRPLELLVLLGALFVLALWAEAAKADTAFDFSAMKDANNKVTGTFFVPGVFEGDKKAVALDTLTNISFTLTVAGNSTTFTGPITPEGGGNPRDFKIGVDWTGKSPVLAVVDGSLDHVQLKSGNDFLLLQVSGMANQRWGGIVKGNRLGYNAPGQNNGTWTANFLAPVRTAKSPSRAPTGLGSKRNIAFPLPPLPANPSQPGSSSGTKRRIAPPLPLPNG